MSQTAADNEAESGGNPPVVPDHSLIQRIGKGAYGEVWFARNSLGACRAVKIVQKDPESTLYSREYSGIKKFEPISREHEGFVDILQVGRDPGGEFFYYVMELADDRSAASEGNVLTQSLGPNGYAPRTLASELEARGSFGCEECIEVAVALCEALEFLHSKGLIHRDIKPANIVFVGGKPKLADVGLVADSGAASMVGTPGYVAPEGPGKAQADIYSLGKILYQMASGKHQEKFPDLPTKFGSSPPDRFLEINEVCLKACETDSAKRYRSAAQMLADLKELAAGHSLVAKRKWRKRITIVRKVSVGAFCIAGAVAFVLYAQGERAAPEFAMVESFDGLRVNTNLWKIIKADWRYFGKPGQIESVVEQSNGELLLRVSAKHADGYTSRCPLWLEMVPDLRGMAACTIHLQFDVEGKRGFASLQFCDSDDPTDRFRPDLDTVSLAKFEAEELVDHKWLKESVTVEILPTVQVAVVHRGAYPSPCPEVVDLNQLKAWHLRFRLEAVSSEGLGDGVAQVRLKHVEAQPGPNENVLIGVVTERVSGAGVRDVSLTDTAGKRIGQTFSNGVFFVDAGSAGSSFQMSKDGYASHTVQAASRQRNRRMHHIRLEKLRYEFSDIVDTVSLGDFPARAIAFGADGLQVMGSVNDTETVVLPVDLEKMKILPNGWTAPISQPFGFACCGDRFPTVRSLKGELYEISPGSGRLVHTFYDSNVPGMDIQWPQGLAFDGTYLWFVEKDLGRQRYHLHAFDLQSRRIVRTAASTDPWITGLAWDGTQFWISSRRTVFSVDPEAIFAGASVEEAKRREFAGCYENLTYGAGHLWASDKSWRRICKIKITD